MFRRIGKVFIGLLGIAVLLAIVQYLPYPRHTYLWDRAYDTGHVIIFGFITVFLLLMGRATCGTTRIMAQYALAIIGGAVLGLAVEIWQRNHGRDAEWVDLFNDIAGGISFAAVFAIFDSAIREPRPSCLQRRWLAVIAGFVLIVAALPLLRDVNIYRVQRAIVPRLLDFEQPWYEKIYYAQTSKFSSVPPPAGWPENSTKPSFVGRVDAKPGKYPGFIVCDAYPDWSGYDHFEWDIYLDDDLPRVFSVRAHDRKHDIGGDYNDRFGRDINLQPGFQTIRIATEDIRNSPRNRTMDMKRIVGFALFTSDLERELTIFIGEARLN